MQELVRARSRPAFCMPISTRIASQQWYSGLQLSAGGTEGVPIAASALLVAYAMRTQGGGSVGIIPLARVGMRT